MASLKRLILIFRISFGVVICLKTFITLPFIRTYVSTSRSNRFLALEFRAGRVAYFLIFDLMTIPHSNRFPPYKLRIISEAHLLQ